MHSDSSTPHDRPRLPARQSAHLKLVFLPLPCSYQLTLLPGAGRPLSTKLTPLYLPASPATDTDLTLAKNTFIHSSKHTNNMVMPIACSPVPIIEISFAPPEEPKKEPFSPFTPTKLNFTPSEDNVEDDTEDQYRPTLLTPPPATSPLRHGRGVGAGPGLGSKAKGLGIGDEQFQTLLRASKERSSVATSAAAKKQQDLRKEVTMKAHKNKQGECSDDLFFFFIYLSSSFYVCVSFLSMMQRNGVLCFFRKLAPHLPQRLYAFPRHRLNLQPFSITPCHRQAYVPLWTYSRNLVSAASSLVEDTTLQGERG